MRVPAKHAGPALTPPAPQAISPSGGSAGDRSRAPLRMLFGVRKRAGCHPRAQGGDVIVKEPKPVLLPLAPAARSPRLTSWERGGLALLLVAAAAFGVLVEIRSAFQKQPK